MLKKLMFAAGIALFVGSLFGISARHAKAADAAGAAKLSSIFQVDIASNDPLKEHEIRRLQDFLILSDLLTIDASEKGIFGQTTKSAVKIFQNKYGLPETGTFGPLTRAKASALLTASGKVLGVSVSAADLAASQNTVNYTFSKNFVIGNRGKEVEKIQQVLSQYGYPANVNGIMDLPTVDSIKDLQEENGILPNGIGNAKTRVILTKLSRSLGPCSGTEQKVIVKKPNGEESYIPGKQIKLKWATCQVPPTEMVQISLLTGEDKTFSLGTTMNDGKQQVSLPSVAAWPEMQPGKNFKIKIQYDTISDISDTAFTINFTAPEIAAPGAVAPGTVPAPAATSNSNIYTATGISAETDASTPAVRIVSDNQTVEAARFKLTAAGSAHDVVNLTLTMSAAAVSVVQSVMLYDGATLLAIQPAFSTVTFPVLALDVPANSSKVITVKYLLGPVSASAGIAQTDLKTTLSSFTAINNASGFSLNGTESNPSGNSLYVYTAVPVIIQQTMPSNALVNAPNSPLVTFKIDAIGGPVSWSRFFFDVYKDMDTKIATTPAGGITLWDVTAGNNTQVAGTFENSVGLYSGSTTLGTITFTPKTEQVITSTKIYALRGTISGATAKGDYVMITLANDSPALIPMATKENILAADPGAPIIWSDMSGTNHASGAADWTSTFGVKNLPVVSSLDW